MVEVTGGDSLTGTLHAPNADLRWIPTQNIEGNVIARTFTHGPGTRSGTAPLAILDVPFNTQLSCTADTTTTTTTVTETTTETATTTETSTTTETATTTATATTTETETETETSDIDCHHFDDTDHGGAHHRYGDRHGRDYRRRHLGRRHQHARFRLDGIENVVERRDQRWLEHHQHEPRGLHRTRHVRPGRRPYDI